ncbi:MAG: hypothetical protein LBK41_07685 [Clostridiales bacterium]|jgi:N-glycosylase/DNA lyase|nr:hypothetical protein [Clostridiales bacterium]
MQNDFDLEQTLLCGQCFRFWKTAPEEYLVAAGDRATLARQDGAGAAIASPDPFWRDYFDLATDYGAVKDELSRGDPVMEEAIAFAPGIRLLRQDPWETLISFIISQNNRIPQIRRVIENICGKYGATMPENPALRAFPTRGALAAADAPSLMECRAGFRADYILSAARSGVDLDALGELPDAELQRELMSLRGVGEKVANCVMLFGFGRRGRYPVDVWIGRATRILYFGGADVPLADIRRFAEEKWGNLAGYAQQYLFHFARMREVK